ncbi:outer membrane protein assembly factor BamA [Flexithrix dorotheae]|uniref:outer membrane protein assembly factor BamA n=1 Tax=Flexithrix dorotheae TaxID=70993 RepID=UPI00037E7C51|nr:outer membrane protein assembly factor BamA [Flexithrix dorotheae]
MFKIYLMGIAFLALPWAIFAQTEKPDFTSIDYGNPKEYAIGGIKVIGAKYLDKNAIISIAGLAPGSTIKIPGDQISLAVKKLWKQGILGDVKISITEISGHKAFLQIEIKERARLSKVSIEGVSKSQQETLMDNMKLIRGKMVTDAIVKNASNIARKYFQEKGFANTTVQTELEVDKSFKNGLILKMKIDKNPKTRIEKIEFEGITAFEEKKIRKQLKKTKEKSLLNILTPSKFIESQWEADKANLMTFYKQNGYQDIKITDEEKTVLPNGNIALKVKVEEGQPYYVRNISWVGNYKYADKALNQLLGIKKGSIYNPQELSQRLNFDPNGTDIYSLYMDDGYLFFQVDPIEIAVDGDSIDLEMRMFEGEQAVINKVIVNGNTLTNDHVIYRELRTIPGQKFSRNNLIRTQRELATLGYFNPETITPKPIPNYNDGTVDIIFDVEESPGNNFELSGGWGGDFGFIGSAGIKIDNFSARKFFSFKNWKGIPQGDGQKLQLKVQANGYQYQNYGLSFTEPWLGGKKPNSLTFSFNHSVNRLTQELNGYDGSLQMDGVTVSLGRRLTIPDDYFSLSNSINFYRYDLNNYPINGFENYSSGHSYNITFNTTIARNNIDNYLFPRRGSSISLSLSLTPPYSAMGNQSFSEVNTQNSFKWIEYHKWSFENSWYFPLSQKLVMATQLKMGVIGQYNQQKALGPFERYIMGGDGLGTQNVLLGTDVIGLRGYENRAIIPPDSDGMGGTSFSKVSFELRYLLTQPSSTMIYLLGFVEGGNNWNNIQEFNPFKVYRSAGFGVRINLPGMGLLGVDWGYGFDEVPGNPGANKGQFHFVLGQRF